VNSERLTGYSRVDVRGTYSTEGHWEFYGEVINLFNHRNYLQRTDDSFPGEPPRDTRSNIYETFERMISFGVRVKF
jgi:outer membrane receptor protein involved in Fe transport